MRQDNFLKPLVYLLAITIVLASCKKEKTECTSNAVTAAIDGESFSSCTVDVILVPATNQIQLYASDDRVGDKTRQISLTFPSDTGTLVLQKVSATNAAASFSIGGTLGNVYLTDSIRTGSITITKYDTLNRLMSGTFYYNCFDNVTGTGVKHITNGIFTNVKWQ